MIRRSLQTLVWKYDKHFTAVVALIPASLQAYSSKLGKITLPSIWATVLMIAAAIAYAGGYSYVALLGVIVIACIPIGSLIKLFVRRARPKTIYAQNMKVKSYSFPSSHTYAATIAGGYLGLAAIAIFPGITGSIIAAIYGLLAVTIGVSRVHVGAHYPSDVTAGWLLGAVVLTAITLM